MDYNYHTHTFRCRHATGSPEEYILTAIDGGIKHMGFSDHSPFIFPDGYESYYRVLTAQTKDYFNELYALREKYKDKIDIKIGLELEYYPDFFDQMLKTAVDAGAEYLIHGQHFLQNEHPDGFHTIAETDNIEYLKEYVSNLVSAIKSGVFTYLAHPDIFNFIGDKKIYDQQMRKICILSREENVPLEINCQGIRSKRNYPNEAFWEIAAQEQSPVTIGFDSHQPAAAYDSKSLAVAKDLIKKLGLNYIGKPTLKLLQK